MSRSSDTFEFWFWVILGAIGGVIGAGIAGFTGAPIWVGVLVGALIAWGFPICFHMLD